MLVIFALIALACLTTPAAADFISAFLVTAAGLTGTAAVVGQAVVGLGLSLGLGYLARRTQPQQSTQVRGMSLSLRAEVNEPREILFGRVATGGSLKYWNTYGPNGNDYVQLWFVIADHECDALEQLYVDGKAVTLQSAISNSNVSGQPVAQYPGRMWVKFHSGAAGQTADADLVAKSGGAWPSAYRGAGLCSVRVTMRADPEVYKTGRPTFRFVVRGAKLYDARKDTTAGGSGSHRYVTPSTHEWTDNPWVASYHYRRGFFVEGQRLGGMNTSVLSLPIGTWAAAMNASDETVGLKGGGNEKRYRANATVAVSSDHRSVLREFISSSAGVEVDSGGYLKPYAGVAQSPVMTITDDDMIVDGEFVYTPKLSRSQLINAVFGSFHDPAQAYEPNALPPRISPDDEEADGGIQLSDHYALAYVTSGTQGQRICEILRRKGRFQRRLQMKLRSRFCVLEAGDWVTVSSERLGFEDLTFEVEQAAYGSDLTTTVVLKETSSSIYSWTAASDELDPTNPLPVPAGGATFTTVAGIAVANAVQPGGGGAQKPALLITWTPVTDATVVDLTLEYRKAGDTVAVSKPIIDPAAGIHVVFEGIQGGIEYEARLLPNTLPKRATVWTAWTSTGDSSDAEIVAAAGIAYAVPPETISLEMLALQVRRELALVTATAAVNNSVQSGLNEAVRQAQQTAQAALGAVLNNTMALRAIRATSGANAIAITETLAAVGGADALSAQWAVAIDVNGNVTGLVQLSGNLDYTQFSVIADRFAVAFPGVNGGAPLPVFSIVDLEGEPTTVISGTLIANAFKAGLVQADKVDAVFGSFGRMTAGFVGNAAGTSYWNLDTSDFQLG